MPELSELLQQVKKKAGQPTDEMPTEEIIPEPGFVVKTQDEGGGKVFINMCGHQKIAAPGNWANGKVPDEVQQALDNVDNLSEAQAEMLRFPLAMSPPRPDKDKKGEACTTFDCCLNLDVVKQASVYRQLKVFLIELALSWVGHKHKMELDRKFKLPKMKYKGETIEPQRIRMDRKQLVTEVKEVAEDPVFPLVTKKLPAGPAKPPAAPGGAPGSTAGGSSSSSTQAGTAGATARAAAGAASSSGRQAGGEAGAPAFRLLGSWQTQGKPVESVSVEVEVPSTLAEQLRGASQSPETGPASPSGSPQAALQALRVDVCGMRVYVGAPGCSELCITLPFAVKSQGAKVELDTHAQPLPVLRLQLPYQPLAEYIAEAQAQAPHEFGQVSLASATVLELEP